MYFTTKAIYLPSHIARCSKMPKKNGSNELTNYIHQIAPDLLHRFSSRLFSVFPGISTFVYCLRGTMPILNVEDGTQVVYGYIGFSCLEVGQLGR
jgi:hypothetical protein